ncbi:MAG: hypothetical protein V9E94_20495 [Microthrixaceae bacterium]
MGTAALVVALVGSVWVGSAGWGSALASVCAVGAVAVAPLVLGFGRPLAGRAWWTLASAHVVVVLVVPRAVMRWSLPARVGRRGGEPGPVGGDQRDGERALE